MRARNDLMEHQTLYFGPGRIFLALGLCLILSASSLAQKTAIYENEASGYRMGMELFEKGKFGAAQHEFKKIAESSDPNSDMKANAEYYAALCALELFNRDAEYLFKRFIQDHPENPKVRTAYFQLGKYKFRKHSYTRAIEWFRMVDKYELSNPELSEYYFKLGYSFFVKGDIEKARIQFYEIKDTETRYTQPAVYYYSHISYLNQNYETALQGFERLKDKGNFQHIVPYYIAQIYYMQKKHEKLIAYAIPLLDSANTKRAPEIARLIGEAYYATDKYDKAVPYLKRYIEQGHGRERKDLYQLAYAYYKSGATDEAIDLFKQVVNTDDALAQNAYYHLADCFIKKDRKKFARFSFRSASKMAFNKKIQEDALFSYAKLSYDLGLNPIFALNKYIGQYPKNKRVNTAYEYLVQVYLTTQNYKKALRSLDRIENKTDKIKAAYQRIAYFRAVELFNDRKFSESVAMFDKSMAYPSDKKIEAESHYWSGEAWYRLNRYKRAVKSYETFIYAPASFGLPVFNQVNYNLGYAYFRQKDYENSNSWFRKFVRHVEADFRIKRTRKDVKQVWSRVGDAYLRIGDGYFIGKDYESALEYYDKTLRLLPDSMATLGFSLVDQDYALFQKALSYGVLGRTEQKISVLLAFMKNHPNSTYTADATFNLGKGYSELAKHDSAIVWYQTVIEDHPNSSAYLKQSILNMGLEYRNKGESQMALVTLNRVWKDYPATREAQDALMALKSIYIDLGDITPWTELVVSLPWANASNAELDSAYYEAVEVLYMKGDCQRAIKDLGSYLEKFPEGFFTLNANYYRAECLSRRGDSTSTDMALEGYDFVIAQAQNAFTEKSLLRAARIYYQRKKYQRSVDLYIELEKIAEYKSNILAARIGTMRGYFLLREYPLATEAAREVISTDKVGSEILAEAHYIIAKSAFETDNYNLALKEFRITESLTHSEIGAASLYYVAYVQYLRSEHDSSEKSIFKLSSRSPSYDHWVAKGFILLADNYVQMDNAFQAKATLQSIIDNSGNEELVNIAREKLAKIVEEEALNQKREMESMDLEIEFEDYDIKYDELFEQDEEDDEQEPDNGKGEEDGKSTPGESPENEEDEKQD